MPGKIILLQAPRVLQKEDVATFGYFPPLGLASLAGLLLAEGFDVEIRDLFAEGGDCREETGGDGVRIGLPDDEIAAYLHSRAPAIVGITNNFTAFSADCLRLAGLVRRSLPQALIVMGGAHASMDARALLQTGLVDVVVAGEGEYVFRELVRRYAAGREQAQSVPGTVWSVQGWIIDNGFAEPVPDLDALPLPAYRLLPMERYLRQKHANFAVAMRYPVGHMITSRGCTFNCIFCSTSRHFKRFRTRSAASVLREMELLMREYGVREFHFHDDSFTADPGHVRDLCTAIIERRLDVRWQVSQGIASHGVDEGLLELMQKAGMYRVGFPIESACAETLRFIRKPVRLEKVTRLIAKCNERGIYCFGCFMIGFPEETRQQVQETVDFIAASDLDYAKVSVTQPLAGSELYAHYERLGLCAAVAPGNSTYFHTCYDTVHFTARELNALRQQAIRRFYRQKLKNFMHLSFLRRSILPKLRSLEHVRYFLRVMYFALKEQVS